MITFAPVKRLILALFLTACGGGETQQPSNVTLLSSEPVSVRGWIAEVEGTVSGDYKTVETEAARRLQVFQNTNVWIDNAPYVSGGVVETGAFMLLDVPPGNVTISFQAPGIESARLVLQNVPGNADILIPAAILKRDGTVAVGDPQKIVVRVPAPAKSAAPAIVAGHTVRVTASTLDALSDRHDYPTPPEVRAPIATVK